ncbi:hypothetical protein DAT35_23710 [Vitiosangium sp. GDMCC 1.1324]|nr:hypothetical protein DAT35_23710 [Vitiosangium sp. GDMCC 1.1324]
MVEQEVVRRIRVLAEAGWGHKRIAREVCYRARLLMEIWTGWLMGISEGTRARVTLVDGALPGHSPPGHTLPPGSHETPPSPLWECQAAGSIPAASTHQRPQAFRKLGPSANRSLSPPRLAGRRCRTGPACRPARRSGPVCRPGRWRAGATRNSPGCRSG